MRDDGFEAFREFVFADESLQAELWALSEEGPFVERTLDLGAEHGFSFTRSDVEEAMRAGRRAWIEHAV